MFSAFKPGSLRLECSSSWNSQFNVFHNGLTSKCTIFALENLYWHSKLKKKVSSEQAYLLDKNLNRYCLHLYLCFDETK